MLGFCSSVLVLQEILWIAVLLCTIRAPAVVREDWKRCIGHLLYLSPRTVAGIGQYCSSGPGRQYML